MKRNKNIDIIRACSILLIIIYHCIALTGTHSQLPKILYINKFVAYGGEIGVTLFFILSGYGVACSLYTKELSGRPYSYGEFIKRRLLRIVPQYWWAILSLLFLTENAGLFRKDGMIHVVSHLLFIHNFSPDTHGSINGALWTMGIIMQYYLIAYFLHRLVKRKPLITCFVTIAATVLCRALIFIILGYMEIDNPWYYFIYGKQLFTALDNFVIGMSIGCIMQANEMKRIQNNWIRVLLLIMDLALVVGLMILSDNKNRLANTQTGWLWNSCLAIVLGFFVWNFANLKPINVKPLAWIAKYEYGIYLWHLIIINTMLAYSSWMNTLAQKSIYLFMLVIIGISCLVGYVSSVGIDEGLMKKLQAKKSAEHNAARS